MLPGESFLGSDKCAFTQSLVCLLAKPFNSGPTDIPFPFTRWQLMQARCSKTMAPAIANSGVSLSRLLALSGFNFSRNAASEFICSLPNAMGGIDVPGRMADGFLK